MSMPVMSLKEFDDMMTQGGYKYSLTVILCLDAAATQVNWAKHPKGPVGRPEDNMADAYDWQVLALKFAESEKQNGVSFEHKVKYLSMADAYELWEICVKWQGYLAKIGRIINFRKAGEK